MSDEGKRTETFIACHLLEAVEGWTDLGLGDFRLYYLRDKSKREVDFVVVGDRKPWMLVEAKRSHLKLSPSLAYFQARTGALHVLQVVVDAEYVEADCLARPGRPLVVAREDLPVAAGLGAAWPCAQGRRPKGRCS